MLVGLAALIVVPIVLSRRPNDRPAVPVRFTGHKAAYDPPSDSDYVGSAACGTCHSQIATSYATHPMSRSATSAARFVASQHPFASARIAGKRQVYEVDTVDGELVHRNLMFDSAGELIYDHVVPVDYVIGSGGQAFAFAHRRGSLHFMSPLNWYSEDQSWNLAPGYVPDDPRRFDRRITDECLSCHVGRASPISRSTNRFNDPPFHETAIGCENCHGPGREHVALQSSSQSGAIADTIVNPAKLDTERRNAVCYQCHLQAEVRVLRYGRSHFDFRPGNRLDDVWTMLVAEHDSGDKAVSHVQQMRASRCYSESAGTLGCISCHDPHSSPPPADRAAFYRARCLRCHTDESCELPAAHRAARANSCIACHMPARATSNIAHVTQTDHRIPRRVDDSPLTDDSPPTDHVTGPSPLAIVDLDESRLQAWERDRALALGAWIHLANHGRLAPPQVADVLKRVLTTAPNDGASLTMLGAMALDHNRLSEAIAFYERARGLPESREAALNGLLKAYYLSADWERALRCADELLALDSGHARAHAMRADTLAHLGQFSEAILAAHRALEFNPTLISVREWLAAMYQRQGQTAKQREQERLIQRMRSARPLESREAYTE